MTRALAPIGLGLLPVVLLLAALVALDSYKLVRLRTVLAVVAAGAAVALLCLAIHDGVIGTWPVSARRYAQTIAPVLEESIKALVVLWLLRRHKMAFLADASILGFAIGAGFAVVENITFWVERPEAHVAVWFVRGAGTAVMHGGATAVVAMASVARATHGFGAMLRGWGGGLAVAILLHALYNQVLVSPLLATAAIVVALPPVLFAVFRNGERAVQRWLHLGFDADTELLDLILTGGISETPVGIYLNSLRERFRGEVMGDLLNYLRIHLELSLAAKGLLLMRDAGFEVEPDPEMRAQIAELHFLERSIGPTGRLAMAPFLAGSEMRAWEKGLLRD